MRGIRLPIDRGPGWSLEVHLYFGSKTFLIAIGRLLHNLLLLFLLHHLLLLILPLLLLLLLHLHLHLGSKTFLMVIGAPAVDERSKEGEEGELEQGSKGFWFPGELLMEEPGSSRGDIEGRFSCHHAIPRGRVTSPAPSPTSSSSSSCVTSPAPSSSSSP